MRVSRVGGGEVGLGVKAFRDLVSRSAREPSAQVPNDSLPLKGSPNLNPNPKP